MISTTPRLLSDRFHATVRAAILATAILGLTLLPQPAARAQGGVITITSPPRGGLSIPHPSFFTDAQYVGNGVAYLRFPNGNPFGYYSYLGTYSSYPGLVDGDYLYHYDMGYECALDARDAQHGIYLYDFASKTFFYTSPTFPFPYLYDFSLQSVVYYYPDPANPGRYNTDGVRYFYNFATGQIITK